MPRTTAKNIVQPVTLRWPDSVKIYKPGKDPVQSARNHQEQTSIDLIHSNIQPLVAMRFLLASLLALAGLHSVLAGVCPAPSDPKTCEKEAQLVNKEMVGKKYTDEIVCD
jgi:hypothetical protein